MVLFRKMTYQITSPLNKKLGCFIKLQNDPDNFDQIEEVILQAKAPWLDINNGSWIQKMAVGNKRWQLDTKDGSWKQKMAVGYKA